MSNNSLIKVAIVGTGFGKQVHLPGFQHHPRTQVITIYHRDLEKAKTISQDFQIPNFTTNFEEVCRSQDVDVVSISTPPFLHYDMAKMALEYDKHILLEKPVNLNSRETQELKNLAQSKGKVAIVDFEFRFIPAWQLLKEYLQENYIGKIRLIKVDWLVASRANPSRGWNWYSLKEQGGGVLGAIGSHVFDYISWLFGDVASVSAHLSCAIVDRPDPLSNNELKPVTADDTCLITLELTNGTPVQINLSSVTYQGRGHWLEIYGEKGTLVLGSSNLKDYVHGFKLYASQDDKPLKEVEIPQRLAFPQVYTDGRLAPFIRVVDRLVTSIDTNTNLAPSLEEGLYSQRLMDLTHQSHELKQRLMVI